MLWHLNYVFCLDVKSTTSQGSEGQFIILHLCSGSSFNDAFVTKLLLEINREFLTREAYRKIMAHVIPKWTWPNLDVSIVTLLTVWPSENKHWKRLFCVTDVSLGRN